MRSLLIVIFTASLFSQCLAIADDNSSFQYEFALSLEHNEIDRVSLGNDPTLVDVDEDPSVDKLIEEDYEFEFSLEYTVNEKLYFFFSGSLIDEAETSEFNNFINTRDIKEEVSGLERKEIGVGIYFGEEIESELKIGRMEFVSTSEWWLWWDEELDAISLESGYGNFEALLAIAEEQARDTTDADFIDPEIDGIKRIIASLSWEFATDQSLNFYYLDQVDNSSSFNLGELEDFARIDEEDADLTWTGISYLGGFDLDSIGELEVELHVARVSGDETVYEFEDPDPDDGMDIFEVSEKEKNSVSGSAQSYLISWTPAALDDWSFIIGGARGSGDSNPNDNRIKSFRQSGLQGDTDVFGELYQPEISNLGVQLVGVEWEFYEGMEVALMSYDYRQQKAADDIRDVSIGLDPDGMNRDLGSEIDLMFMLQAYDGLELILVAAEFEAGKAYGVDKGETSSFVKFELSYEF